MQNKLLVSLISSILLVSTSVPSYSEFNYQFEIRTNSYSPLDEASGYYYKEQLIDKVEYQLFTLDEREHNYYIINHLDEYKFYDDVKVNYQMGTICVTIGEGKGMLIKGKFKKNVCDENVIREKYYILELFK